ncbi:hypothetical protein M0R89_21215 (plasmid) [Halorussus limi]|uniref:Uncharacterized protein n=1 Tax=Halorussus limi TaxID=2938695 RepID=A0A8U0I1C8_9EURY|nr:hypothetical protein [Halorussus limi]UPV76716.1 hypothetical protein M0R89_21215 [Halorussus limi]
MTDQLLQEVVTPVASVEGAKATCERVRSRGRDGGGNVSAVHAIEKTGGAPDKEGGG